MYITIVTYFMIRDNTKFSLEKIFKFLETTDEDFISGR